MLRRGLLLICLGLLSCPVFAQAGPGLFGDRRWRAPVANAAALPASGSVGEMRLTLDDGALHYWDGNSWEAVAGGVGGGEINTASNLGGGVGLYAVKVGADLQFNSLFSADFALASNVVTINDAKWAKDSELPTDTNAGTICAGTTTYLDGEGLCDDLSAVYSLLGHGHVLSALSGAVTDAQVPNTITVDFATTAGGAPPTGAAGGDLGGAYPDPTVDDDGHAHTASTLSGQLADAQKVTVRKNSGADVGTRARLNLIEGSGVTLTVADDGAGGEVDVTVAASGGSGIGGSVGSTDNAIPRADGTGGATLQGSLATIDDLGALALPAGTEGAPALTFGGMAAGSGLWGKSTYELGFSVAGLNYFTLDYNGLRTRANATFRYAPLGEPIYSGNANDTGSGLGSHAFNDMAMYANLATAHRWLFVAGTTARSLTVGQGADSPQAVSCADSGDGSPGAVTVNPLAALVFLTNLDADGCAVTLGETNVTAGVRLELDVVATAGGSVSFSDTSGVTELAGAFAAGLYDSLALRYVSDRWVETGRSDN